MKFYFEKLAQYERERERDREGDEKNYFMTLFCICQGMEYRSESYDSCVAFILMYCIRNEKEVKKRIHDIETNLRNVNCIEIK